VVTAGGEGGTTEGGNQNGNKNKGALGLEEDIQNEGQVFKRTTPNLTSIKKTPRMRQYDATWNGRNVNGYKNNKHGEKH